MKNTHSIFWDTKGAEPRKKVCDVEWNIGSAPSPTTHIASRPIGTFDFSRASAARNELELADMLSQHCKDINDIPEASFLVATRELPSNIIYRKICRNTDQDANILNFSTPMFPGETEERVAFLHQCEVLIERIRTISQVVQLDDRTLESFGDEIRNVLILSCTEIEAISKSILSANGTSAKNIFDFFKLERACRLSEYSVSFTRFPGLSPVKPFLSWAPSTADGRLPWYTAYNHTKHDRISNVAEGNLGNALNATAGIIALLCASYGWPAIRTHSRISDFTTVNKYPSFGLAECYMFTSEQIVENGKGRFVPNPIYGKEYSF